jgi:hypothetical protein
MFYYIDMHLLAHYIHWIKLDGETVKIHEVDCDGLLHQAVRYGAHSLRVFHTGFSYHQAGKFIKTVLELSINGEGTVKTCVLFILPKYPRSPLSPVSVSWSYCLKVACASRMRSLPSCITFIIFHIITYITTPEYFLTAFHTRKLPWRLQFFGVLYFTRERYLHIACEEKWHYLNVRSSDNCFILLFR